VPEHTFTAGLRLAVTTMTVVPLRPGRVDRATAAVAMAVTPLVGAVLGAVLGGVLAGMHALPTPPLVAGTVTVALGVLLTRGLHLDGLADTVDALGVYGSRERALEVMRRPDIGPFGVAAVVLVLLAQAASYASTGFVPVVVAVAAGRVAIGWACRRGVPAARPDGLGALVAGTLPLVVPLVFTLVLLAAAVYAVPGRPWQGPGAVAAGLVGAALLVRHAVRRFGGITGDVLGAACEVATTLTLVALAAAAR